MRIRPIRKSPTNEAAKDLRFLLERGYPKESAVTFIGNHYQLRLLERDVIFRGVFTKGVVLKRKRKCVQPADLAGARLVIDGYNCLITLESAIRGLPVFKADDGFIRDASRVFRGFRQTEKTRTAWKLIERMLVDYPPEKTVVLLDKPMSRSGDLAVRIRKWMKLSGISGTCITVKRVEKSMLRLDGIKASADSAIIDDAQRAFDLSGHIITRRLHVRPFRLR